MTQKERIVFIYNYFVCCCCFVLTFAHVCFHIHEQSFNSYLPRPQDTTLRLGTGEVVSLKINNEVFGNNGQLKGHARFSGKR